MPYNENFTEMEKDAKTGAQRAAEQDIRRYANVRPGGSAGIALWDNFQQEMLDTAATMTELSAYFSRTRNSLKPDQKGDELDEELREYTAGGFGFDEYKSKLYSTVDLIDKLAVSLKEYAGFNTKVNGSQKERSVAFEADKYNEIKSMLDQCMTNLNSCMEYKESESVMFRNLYSQVANTTILLEDMADGHLILPLRNEKKDLYGRTIHRVIVLDNELSLESGGLDANEASQKKQLDSTAPFNEYYTNVSDVPLFPHEPNENDLSQGALGNCYMLASLSAIARTDPGRIKDAIRDNKNGTVTVRFYNDKKEPVYVTVQKSVPTVDTLDSPFSQGALWVKMIEKAYAASGLKSTKLEKDTDRFASYGRIESGEEKYFLRAFLGPDASAENMIDNNEIIFSETVGTDYSVGELETYTQIQNALKSGHIVAAGTRSEKDYEIIRQEKGEDPLKNAGGKATESSNAKTYLGIFRKHAYTVTGVIERNGQKFIRLRNPHNSDGLSLDRKGNITPLKDAQGEVFVELSNFRMLFRSVAVAKTDMLAKDRAMFAQAQRFRNTYGSALRDLVSELKSTENIFNWSFHDSPQFRSFDDAGRKLLTALEAEPPLMTPIDRYFKDFLSAAEAYHSYRTAPTDDPRVLAERRSKENNSRSIRRLALTERVLRFRDAYNLAAAEEAALSNQPRPSLKEQADLPHDELQKGDAAWVTPALIDQRIEQRRKILLEEEDYTNAGRAQIEKTAKSLTNLRFKELRHILCEGDLEENAAINAALLEARAYLRAGHSAEDLRKTDLAANPRVAPYFDILAEVVAADDAQRENDLRFAERFLETALPGYKELTAKEEAARQKAAAEKAAAEKNAVPPEDLPVQKCIQEVLNRCRAEDIVNQNLTDWKEKDEKYRIPGYHGNAAQEKLGTAIHVRTEDRAARRELSLQAVRAHGLLQHRSEAARRITEAMIRNTQMDQARKDKCLKFIEDHKNLLEAFLDPETTPQAARENLKRIDALANGTEQKKGQVLEERMTRLVGLCHACRIAAPQNAAETIETITKNADTMNAVKAMRKYLHGAEGQHSGVSLDDITSFKKEIKENFEAYNTVLFSFNQLRDPVYQYLDKNAATKCLAEYSDKMAESLKEYNDRLTEKKALPESPANEKEIHHLQTVLKKITANIIGLAQAGERLNNVDIKLIADAELVFTDYYLAAACKTIEKDPNYAVFADKIEYNQLLKTEENGKLTLNRQEARNLYKMYQAVAKADRMNKKLEEEQLHIEEVKAAKQAKIGENNGPAVPGIY